MRNHPAQSRKDFSLTLPTESNTMTSPSTVYTNQLKSAGDQHEDMVNALFKDMGKREDNLMHAAAGIAGEAGELLDAVKKQWAYGKKLDRANVIEELGDLEFYMRALRANLNISREEVLIANIKKLSKRYSSGKYSDQQAQDRADKIPENTSINWPSDFDKAVDLQAFINSCPTRCTEPLDRSNINTSPAQAWGLAVDQYSEPISDFDKAAELPEIGSLNQIALNDPEIQAILEGKRL